MLMTAAVTDELSRLPHTKACCRRAEMIALLRFAGAVHQEAGRIRIEVDLDTPLVARNLGAAIRALYGYPTQVQVLHATGHPARYRLRMATNADAAALARRTARAVSGRAAARKVEGADHIRLKMPLLGSIRLPEPQRLAYYTTIGALGVLGVLGVLEWPVALVLAGGHALASDQHNRAVQQFGEALEDA